MRQAALTAVFTFVLLLPVVTHAAVDTRTSVDFPPDAIGVSEEQFQAIKDATCSYDYCDPLIEQLQGKVIFRAERHGQMYKVAEGDGVQKLRPFLPNGFYKAGKKYYYVANGFKIRLKKGSAYRTILQRAQDGSTMITPLSDYDFQGMVNTCEDYSELYGGTSDQYYECVEQNEVGQRVRERLQGTIVFGAQGTGQLYYLPYIGTSTPYPVVLDKKVDQKSFFAFVKDNALKVKKKQMRRVLSGKLY